MLTDSRGNTTVFAHKYGNYSIKTAVAAGSGYDVVIGLDETGALQWYASRWARNETGWMRRGIGWAWVAECWRCGCRLLGGFTYDWELKKRVPLVECSWAECPTNARKSIIS